MRGLVVLCLLAWLSGCGATRHARSVEESGFLSGAYSMMREGKNDEALRIRILSYWKSYKKIMIYR